MLLYRTLRKVTSTNMRKKNMYVVTPRCAAAAAVVSALVLRRPTKEYTHPYSMMHRRLPTAGIEVAPHYHQLLVNTGVVLWFCLVGVVLSYLILRNRDAISQGRRIELAAISSQDPAARTCSSTVCPAVYRVISVTVYSLIGSL